MKNPKIKFRVLNSRNLKSLKTNLVNVPNCGDIVKIDNFDYIIQNKSHIKLDNKSVLVDVFEINLP